MPPIQGLAPVLDILQKNARIAWAGNFPPRFDMAAAPWLYDAQSDFRSPPHLHQTFELVMLMERDLGQSKQWPQILDEALRLLAPGGTIVVRFRDSPVLSVFEFASLLETSPLGRFELIDEILLSDNFTLLSARLVREDLRPASVRGFSFALVTDGRKPEQVRRFVESVVNLDMQEEHDIEILICGPDKVLSDLGDIGALVRLAPQPEAFETRGWITAKKNRLVTAARFENILVVHDRYFLPPGFLTRMRAFGGDFSALVMRQETQDGQRIADWVMLQERFTWSRSMRLEDGDYDPNVYINGGAILAKTDLLRDVPWSEMLFWNQAEDVELTRRLQAHGVVPRLARHVRIFTDPPRPGYAAGFERAPRIPGYVSLLSPEAAGRIPIRFDEPLDFCRLAPEQLSSHGAVLPSAWEVDPQGATWLGTDDPELYVRLGPRAADRLRLDFATAEDRADVAAVSINAARWPLPPDPGACHCVLDLTPEILGPAGNLNLRLERMSGEPLRLRALYVRPEPARFDIDEEVSFDVTGGGGRLLGDGWHTPEDWGVWGSRRSSELRFQPPLFTADENLELHLEVQVYDPFGQERVLWAEAAGMALGLWTLPPGLRREIIIPLSVWGGQDGVTIEVGIDRLGSPAEVGLPDPRELSLGLYTARLVHASN